MARELKPATPTDARTKALALWYTAPRECNLNEVALPALGPDDDPDHALTRPYTLEMYATDGEHLPFERWQRLRLEVDVTEATELSPEDEAKARFGQRRFRVDAHCDGDRFVADRIVSRLDGPMRWQEPPLRRWYWSSVAST